METHHDGCPPSPTAPSSSGSCTNSNTILSPRPPPPPQPAAATTQPPPLTPRRSGDPNPFPTTFIQADTTSFKQVVQMLTGSPDTAAKHTAAPPPRPRGPKKQPFKLYERRSSFRHLKTISPLLPSSSPSPRKHPEILSPSILDLPSLVLSPVTPLIHDPWCSSASSEEDRAIAERGFYLHPSPRTTPRELLPLFPLTSPSSSVGHQP